MGKLDVLENIAMTVYGRVARGNDGAVDVKRTSYRSRPQEGDCKPADDGHLTGLPMRQGGDGLEYDRSERRKPGWSE